MDKSALTLLANIENSWWYRGRARMVVGLLTKYVAKKNLTTLDYGSGNGGMFSYLQEISGIIDAYEPHTASHHKLSRRKYRKVYGQESEALGNAYDVVALCDVLEHIEDDVETLKKIYSSLPIGGHIAITLPAFQWLWGPHDVAHHHFRRYTIADIRKKLESAGLEVVYASYWNMILFVPVALMRLIGRTGEDALTLPKTVDQLLYLIVSIEAWLMSVYRLPFGLSVVIIGRRIS